MDEKPPTGGDSIMGAGRAPLAPESSIELLRRAKVGDAAALDRLCARYMLPLHRWATGRLPRWARDLLDTDDLVQDTIVGVLPRLEVFEFRHDGALQAFLRAALLNRIREEIRKTGRRPRRAAAEIERADPAASPLEEVLGLEAVAQYEAALARVSEDDRAAIVARIEMHCSYEEVSEALGKPSPDAARMAVSRALLRLAKEMRREQR